jgi:hypothetical protein
MNAVFLLVPEGVRVVISGDTARVVVRLAAAGPLVRSFVEIRGVLCAFELS